MKKHYLLIFFLFFIVGVFIGDIIYAGSSFIVLLTLLSATFLGLGFLTKNNSKTFTILFIVFIALVAGLLRVNLSENKDEFILDEFVGKNYEAVGIVSSEPVRREKNLQYEVAVSSFGGENITETKVLVYDDTLSEVFFGDSLLLHGKLTRPANYYEEKNLLNGDEFDWVGYLARRDIHYQMFYPTITIQEDNILSPFTQLRRSLFSIKKAFVKNIERVLPEPQSALLAGEVVGVRNSISNDLEEKLRKTGIIHVIVLSGYNVTIIADSFIRTLSFLSISTALFGSIIGIILFVFLTGGSATVVRAGIMAILALLARYSGRVYDVTIGLFFAGFLMILYNPNTAFDASFQLSFIATLGLLYISPAIERRLSFITNKFALRGVIAATIGTQIAVFPLLAFLMGEISIVSIFVNALILPIIPITMFFGFLVGMTGFILLPLSHFFGIISGILTLYQLYIVEFFANFPFASIQF